MANLGQTTVSTGRPSRVAVASDRKTHTATDRSHMQSCVPALPAHPLLLPPRVQTRLSTIQVGQVQPWRIGRNHKTLARTLLRSTTIMARTKGKSFSRSTWDRERRPTSTCRCR